MIRFNLKNKNINKLFDYAIKNGGATIDQKKQITNFKKGFQVSKKDCYIVDIDKKSECLQKITNVLNNIKKDEFCGLWIDKNKLYIDISINITEKQKAVEIGKKLKQLSIYDWQQKICINLK